MKVLEGIVVLDFSRLLPGPLATKVLMGLGARVIRVEHPEYSDMARSQPPFEKGESTLFRTLNSGKESLVLNYTSPEGRATLFEWVAKVDIVVEQFRPGRMSEWGLGYSDLKAYKPDLIYASLSGYGQTGPYAQQAGHDLNYLAYSGLLDLNRDANGRPVIPAVQLADIGGGTYPLVQAILAALLQRERKRKGAFLDVSMLDGVMPMLTIPQSQLAGGWDPKSVPFLQGGLVNYNLYECGDGRWVALGALELKFWNAFCELVDRQEWKRTNQFELSIDLFPKAEVDRLFLSRSQSDWVKLAAGKDICLSPIQTLEEALNDPHQLERAKNTQKW